MQRHTVILGLSSVTTVNKQKEGRSLQWNSGLDRETASINSKRRQLGKTYGRGRIKREKKCALDGAKCERSEKNNHAMILVEEKGLFSTLAGNFS